MNRRLMQCLAILTLVAAVTACTSGGRELRGSSAVTLAIGGRETEAQMMRKAPPVVASVTITITGADMTPIARTITVTPPADLSQVFTVPNGPGRTFAVEARDAGGTPAYRGSATADLDGTPITLNIGLTPLFFAGTKQFGTAAFDEANAIARDGSGNLFIAGSTTGALDGNTVGGGMDAYLMKFDGSGARLWTKLVGSAGDESAFSVAADGTGGAYVFGITTGSVGGKSRTGLVDCFVARYDSSGTQSWISQFGGSQGLCNAGGAAADASGNLYITGYTDSSLDGKAVFGGFDVFAMKYDPSGTRAWTSIGGTAFNDYGNAIVLDNSGNILIAGSTFGSLATTNPNPDGTTSDIFAVKIDTATGGMGFLAQLGTVENDDAWAIAVDSVGSFYIAGGTFGSLDGSSSGLYDVFVVKYDAAGMKQWTRQAGSAGSDIAQSAAIDSSGNVLVTGRTNGSLDGNTGSGSYDIFLMKFDTAGTRLWTRLDGTIADDAGAGTVADGSGNVYITGTTKGGLDGNTNAGDADGFLQAYDVNGVLQ